MFPPPLLLVMGATPGVSLCPMGVCLPRLCGGALIPPRQWREQRRHQCTVRCFSLGLCVCVCLSVALSLCLSVCCVCVSVCLRWPGSLFLSLSLSLALSLSRSLSRSLNCAICSPRHAHTPGHACLLAVPTRSRACGTKTAQQACTNSSSNQRLHLTLRFASGWVGVKSSGYAACHGVTCSRISIVFPLCF